MTLLGNGDDRLTQVLQWLRRQSTACYIVGGTVREWLRGCAAKDLDIAVDGAALVLARRLANETGGSYYVLDRETDAGRVVYQGDRELTVDLAGLRGPDIIADLRGRDFTINAMALAVGPALESAPVVLDPCDGQGDLSAGLLRATHEAAFREDPVRLLRAVRFAASLDLRVESNTLAWLSRDAALVVRPSAERVRQELAALVGLAKPSTHLRTLDDLGLLAPLLPELTSLKQVSGKPPGTGTGFDHSLVVLAELERLASLEPALLSDSEAACLMPFASDLRAHLEVIVAEKRPRWLLVRFAAMLHDTGKVTAQFAAAEGTGAGRGHAERGADIAARVMTRLRFATAEGRLVRTVVLGHMRPGLLNTDPPAPRRAAYRFFRDVGDCAPEVLLLSLADHRASRGAALLPDHWKRHLALSADLMDHFFRRPEELVRPPQLLTGEDVMAETGEPPGPSVGRWLEAVREAQAAREISSRDEALCLVRRGGRSRADDGPEV